MHNTTIKNTNEQDIFGKTVSSQDMYFKETFHFVKPLFASFDENYLFVLFKYLEFNPIQAKISKKLGTYKYTLLHDIIKGSVKSCMKDSFVLQWYDTSAELLEAMGINISEEEIEKIAQFQKDSTTYKSNPKRVEQKLNLKDYFHDDMSKIERNEAILKAYHDGFIQSEIAKFLGLSGAGVSKILKKVKS